MYLSSYSKSLVILCLITSKMLISDCTSHNTSTVESPSADDEPKLKEESSGDTSTVSSELMTTSKLETVPTTISNNQPTAKTSKQPTHSALTTPKLPKPTSELTKTEEGTMMPNGTNTRKIDIYGVIMEEKTIWLIVMIAVVYSSLVLTIVALKICAMRKLRWHKKDRNVATVEAEGPEEEDPEEHHPDAPNVSQSGESGQLAAPIHMKDILDVLDNAKEMIDRDLQDGRGKDIEEDIGTGPKPDSADSTTTEVTTEVQIETESNTNGNLQNTKIDTSTETTAVVDCDQTEPSEPLQNMDLIKTEEGQLTVSEQHGLQMPKSNNSWSKSLLSDVDLLHTDSSVGHTEGAISGECLPPPPSPLVEPEDGGVTENSMPPSPSVTEPQTPTLPTLLEMEGPMFSYEEQQSAIL